MFVSIKDEKVKAFKTLRKNSRYIKENTLFKIFKLFNQSNAYVLDYNYGSSIDKALKTTSVNIEKLYFFRKSDIVLLNVIVDHKKVEVSYCYKELIPTQILRKIAIEEYLKEDEVEKS